ncbi:Uncharacterised protein [Vibrio cholerae]|nr:Uncharacterised protein [Vibrio cholerae]
MGICCRFVVIFYRSWLFFVQIRFCCFLMAWIWPKCWLKTSSAFLSACATMLAQVEYRMTLALSLVHHKSPNKTLG